jgi:hypothetical protein
MDVEIDLYSGRPNPRLRLGSAAAAELIRRVATLRPSTGNARPRDRLGYRGLRVEPDAAGSPFAEVFVSAGVVLVQDLDGRERLLEDPNRDLERWLIESISSEVDTQVVALLRQDLASPW